MATVRDVRVSLPLTLTLSLAVHVGLMTAIVFSFLPRSASPVGTTAERATSSILLMRAKAALAPASKQLAPAQPVATVAAAPLPPLPAPPIEHPGDHAAAPAAPAPPPALAMEANPNAHIRAIAPDSILSPSPPPRVNSANAVVFILDISGSMYEPFAGSTRIVLARETLSQQIAALKNGTPFAITLYALNATNSGPLVAATDATREAAVRFIMRDVDCGGGTNLPAGLTAAQQLHPGALVLVTDGDLNSAAYTLEARTRELLGPEGKCPALTVIGIAPRASQHAQPLLESLAEQQGGIYRTAVPEHSANLVSAASAIPKPASATP